MGSPPSGLRSHDEATPNANGVAAQNLVRLAALTGDDHWRRRRDALFDGLLPARRRASILHTSLANASTCACAPSTSLPSVRAPNGSRRQPLSGRSLTAWSCAPPGLTARVLVVGNIRNALDLLDEQLANVIEAVTKRAKRAHQSGCGPKHRYRLRAAIIEYLEERLHEARALERRLAQAIGHNGRGFPQRLTCRASPSTVHADAERNRDPHDLVGPQ